MPVEIIYLCAFVFTAAGTGVIYTVEKGSQLMRPYFPVPLEIMSGIGAILLLVLFGSGFLLFNWWWPLLAIIAYFTVGFFLAKLMFGTNLPVPLSALSMVIGIVLSIVMFVLLESQRTDPYVYAPATPRPLTHVETEGPKILDPRLDSPTVKRPLTGTDFEVLAANAVEELKTTCIRQANETAQTYFSNLLAADAQKYEALLPQLPKLINLEARACYYNGVHVQLGAMLDMLPERAQKETFDAYINATIDKELAKSELTRLYADFQ